MAEPLLEMVTITLTVRVSGPLPRTGLILGTAGRNTALLSQERPFTPPHKAENDTNDGRASDTRPFAMEIALSTEIVTRLARLR